MFDDRDERGLDGSRKDEGIQTSDITACKTAANFQPKSFIYFVQCDGPGNPIKIGHAKKVDERRSNLQMGCPYPLRVIGYAPVEDGPAVEEHLHYQFAKARIRGEWFASVPELLALIRTAEAYREAIRDYIWGASEMPAVPIELVPVSMYAVESIDVELAADVAEFIAAARRADAKQSRELHAWRSAGADPETKPKQSPLKLKSQPKTPGPGEFVWRGKIRKR